MALVGLLIDHEKQTKIECTTSQLHQLDKSPRLFVDDRAVDVMVDVLNANTGGCSVPECPMRYDTERI
jgi:hypothetical protein